MTVHFFTEGAHASNLCVCARMLIYLYTQLPADVHRVVSLEPVRAQPEAISQNLLQQSLCFLFFLDNWSLAVCIALSVGSHVVLRCMKLALCVCVCVRESAVCGVSSQK